LRRSTSPEWEAIQCAAALGVRRFGLRGLRLRRRWGRRFHGLRRRYILRFCVNFLFRCVHCLLDLRNILCRRATLGGLLWPLFVGY
jgi:hypothetical protein